MKILLTFSLTFARSPANIRNLIFTIGIQLFGWDKWFPRRWTTVLKNFSKVHLLPTPLLTSWILKPAKPKLNPIFFKKDSISPYSMSFLGQFPPHFTNIFLGISSTKTFYGQILLSFSINLKTFLKLLSQSTHVLFGNESAIFILELLVRSTVWCCVYTTWCITSQWPKYQGWNIYDIGFHSNSTLHLNQKSYFLHILWL